MNTDVVIDSKITKQFTAATLGDVPHNSERYLGPPRYLQQYIPFECV